MNENPVHDWVTTAEAVGFVALSALFQGVRGTEALGREASEASTQASAEGSGRG